MYATIVTPYNQRIFCRVEDLRKKTCVVTYLIVRRKNEYIWDDHTHEIQNSYVLTYHPDEEDAGYIKTISGTYTYDGDYQPCSSDEDSLSE